MVTNNQKVIPQLNLPALLRFFGLYKAILDGGLAWPGLVFGTDQRTDSTVSYFGVGWKYTTLPNTIPIHAPYKQ